MGMPVHDGGGPHRVTERAVLRVLDARQRAVLVEVDFDLLERQRRPRRVQRLRGFQVIAAHRELRHKRLDHRIGFFRPRHQHRALRLGVSGVDNSDDRTRLRDVGLEAGVHRRSVGSMGEESHGESMKHIVETMTAGHEKHSGGLSKIHAFANRNARDSHMHASRANPAPRLHPRLRSDGRLS